jgi:hypothetical protein
VTTRGLAARFWPRNDLISRVTVDHFGVVDPGGQARLLLRAGESQRCRPASASSFSATPRRRGYGTFCAPGRGRASASPRSASDSRTRAPWQTARPSGVTTAGSGSVPSEIALDVGPISLRPRRTVLKGRTATGGLSDRYSERKLPDTSIDGAGRACFARKGAHLSPPTPNERSATHSAVLPRPADGCIVPRKPNRARLDVRRRAAAFVRRRAAG